jgi:hypothetical protein
MPPKTICALITCHYSSCSSHIAETSTIQELQTMPIPLLLHLPTLPSQWPGRILHLLLAPNPTAVPHAWLVPTRGLLLREPELLNLHYYFFDRPLFLEEDLDLPTETQLKIKRRGTLGASCFCCLRSRSSLEKAVVYLTIRQIGTHAEEYVPRAADGIQYPQHKKKVFLAVKIKTKCCYYSICKSLQSLITL